MLAQLGAMKVETAAYATLWGNPMDAGTMIPHCCRMLIRRYGGIAAVVFTCGVGTLSCISYKLVKDVLFCVSMCVQILQARHGGRD